MSAGSPSAASALVVSDYGRRYEILPDGAAEPLPAMRRGKRDDVAVGDRVAWADAGGEAAVIEAVEPRRRVLFRADENRTKVLAANVDLVVVVFAPKPPFHLQFLWRALVAAEAADLQVLAVLNKADLLAPGDEASKACDELAGLGVATLRVSARTTPEETRRQLAAALGGRACLFVGQSGMGKSTLLNLLVPTARSRTSEISERLNIGRQTTTATRWYALPPLQAGDPPGAIIDAPGFQRFGLAHLDPRQVAACMPDLAPIAQHCRFDDCRHDVEPGCAVRAAVDAGTLDPRRFAFYRSLCADWRSANPPR